MNKIWIGIAGVFLLIAVSLFGTYNNLVGKSTVIDGQWAQVETQYQRRFDLIPNLVNSTKGFLEQEKEIFETIAQARTQYAGARTVDRKVETAGGPDSTVFPPFFFIPN